MGQLPAQMQQTTLGIPPPPNSPLWNHPNNPHNPASPYHPANVAAPGGGYQSVNPFQPNYVPQRPQVEAAPQGVRPSGNIVQGTPVFGEPPTPAMAPRPSPAQMAQWQHQGQQLFENQPPPATGQIADTGPASRANEHRAMFTQGVSLPPPGQPAPQIQGAGPQQQAIGPGSFLPQEAAEPKRPTDMYGRPTEPMPSGLPAPQQLAANTPRMTGPEASNPYLFHSPKWFEAERAAGRFPSVDAEPQQTQPNPLATG